MNRSVSRGLQMNPHQPTKPSKAAAEFLRLVANRYVNDRANRVDVDRAIDVWQTALREEARAAVLGEGETPA